MRLLLALFCLMAISVSFMKSSKPIIAAPVDYDIIIRNGRVVDGGGRPGVNADVAIKGDRIARIGNLDGA